MREDEKASTFWMAVEKVPLRLARAPLVLTMFTKRKTSKTRIPLALTLICASFLSAYFFAIFANKGSNYWIVKNAISIGQQISANDVEIISATIPKSSQIYLKSITNPIGFVAANAMESGEFLKEGDISSTMAAITSDAVPISARAADVAAGVGIGSKVDIYWVGDKSSGQFVSDPILVLGEVALIGRDESGKNFGSDVALTVLIEKTQVLRVLTSTTHGRLVIVKSHV